MPGTLSNKYPATELFVPSGPTACFFKILKSMNNGIDSTEGNNNYFTSKF